MRRMIGGGGHALAAAGLAHEPQGLSRLDREAHVIHGLEDAAADIEVGS